MVDLEDIYEGYKKEIEHLDNGFLKEIKLSKNKRESELKYLSALKKIRERYYKLYHNELRISTKKETVELKDINLRLKKREIENQKENPLKKEDGKKIFRVEPLKMGLSKKEKKKFEKDLKRFKNQIKRNNLKRKFTPLFIIVLHIRTKLFIRRVFQATKKKSQDTYQGTKYACIKFYMDISTKVKNITVYTRKKISAVIKNLSSKLKKQKKEENKSEDQKIAERLIAKS